jgi:urease accessory protein
MAIWHLCVCSLYRCACACCVWWRAQPPLDDKPALSLLRYDGEWLSLCVCVCMCVCVFCVWHYTRPNMASLEQKCRAHTHTHSKNVGHHVFHNSAEYGLHLSPSFNCAVTITHTRTHTHARTHAHARTCTHTHAHAHAHAHTHTHTHTHTQMHNTDVGLCHVCVDMHARVCVICVCECVYSCVCVYTL